MSNLVAYPLPGRILNQGRPASQGPREDIGCPIEGPGNVDR